MYQALQEMMTRTPKLRLTLFLSEVSKVWLEAGRLEMLCGQVSLREMQSLPLRQIRDTHLSTLQTLRSSTMKKLIKLALTLGFPNLSDHRIFLLRSTREC